MIAQLAVSQMENRSQAQLAQFGEELGQIFLQMCAKPVGISCSNLKEEIGLWLLNPAIVVEELTLFIHFFQFLYESVHPKFFLKHFIVLLRKKQLGRTLFCLCINPPGCALEFPAYLGAGWILAHLCVISAFPYKEKEYNQCILHPLSNKSVGWVIGTWACGHIKGHGNGVGFAPCALLSKESWACLKSNLLLFLLQIEHLPRASIIPNRSFNQ